MSNYKWFKRFFLLSKLNIGEHKYASKFNEFCIDSSFSFLAFSLKCIDRAAIVNCLSSGTSLKISFKLLTNFSGEQ